MRECTQIDFVSAKVEQLGIHGRKAGLTAGLRDDAGDNRVFEYDFRLPARGDFCHFNILRLTQDSDDVIRCGAARRRVDHRKQRFDDICVFVFVDDDRTRGMQTQQSQVVEVDCAAVSCDDARGLRVRNSVANRLVHLYLVGRTHDDDASVLLIAVCFDELGQNRKDLVRPAEDDGVVFFNDDGMPFLERFKFGGYARGQETDEDAKDEDTAECDNEHCANKQEAARVAAHRTRIERAEHAHPEQREETGFLICAAHPNDERDDGDHEQRHNRETCDQYACSLGHQVVKTILEFVFHRHLI